MPEKNTRSPQPAPPHDLILESRARLTVTGVQKVLQLLVRENVSIRDMLTIVETLGDFGGSVKNPDMLAEYVREKLSRSIVRPYLDSQGVLPVLTLNGNAERMVQEGIRQTDNGATFLSLNPAAAQRLMQNINACAWCPYMSVCGSEHAADDAEKNSMKNDEALARMENDLEERNGENAELD